MRRSTVMHVVLSELRAKEADDLSVHAQQGCALGVSLLYIHAAAAATLLTRRQMLLLSWKS